jgi:4-hydroxy-4-methyl-2-oxoglutarate aldolase
MIGPIFECEEQKIQFLKQNLHVAVVCDVLDTLGYRDQAMHSRLRPLLPDILACGFVGRARTLQWMKTDHISEDDPYGLELEALDSLKPGDVVVHAIDPTADCTPWGELMTTAAMRNGAVGCICDSSVRDCVKIIKMGFPVYHVGMRPLDSKGRCIVKDFDVPVECGEVWVRPGELIFADFDGIVVVPKEVEQEALELAAKKVEQENLVRKDLDRGGTMRETYEKYRVL